MKRRYAGTGGGGRKGADAVLTEWCGQVISRSHAFLPRIRDVADHQSRNEITSLSIRGREGTGKTTIARLISHTLHQELQARAVSTEPAANEYEARHRESLKRGYLVRFLKAKDLENFADIMQRLPDQNRILVFDDASFIGASASRAVMKIKHELTTVRHAAGQDVKVVLIFNFHYSRALDPYLRDTHFILQSNITTQEARNMRELYDTAPGNMALLYAYQRFTRLMQKNGKVTVNLGTKKALGRTVTYRYSDPFRLGTWFDGETLSLFVYPAAGGAPGAPDPLNVDECELCRAQVSTGQQLEGKLNPVEVIEWMKRQWARPDMVGAALRNVCIRRYGRDPGNRHANLGMEMIERLDANGVCTFEDLAHAYASTTMKSTDGMDALLETGKRTRLPSTKRAAFAMLFGKDGLRAPGSKSLTPDAIKAAEQAAVEAEQLR